jgi:hypothetical protein
MLKRFSKLSEQIEDELATGKQAQDALLRDDPIPQKFRRGGVINKSASGAQSRTSETISK